jgi:broad specificity phosphatase PhoE
MKNKYFLLRHGETLSIKKNLISCWPERFHNPLTPKGLEEAQKAAGELKKKKIDLIFFSDLLRTKQTAEIVGKKLKIDPIYEKRLREVNVGKLNGAPIAEFRKFFKGRMERFTKKLPGGENNNDIRERMYKFFQDLEKKYSGKRILLVSHQLPFVLLEAKIRGLDDKKTIDSYKEMSLELGKWKELKDN